MKMKKTSLFNIIFYFLKRARSTSRICKGRDIAVILTEKRWAVDIVLLKLRLFKKKIPDRNKSDNPK